MVPDMPPILCGTRLETNESAAIDRPQTRANECRLGYETQADLALRIGDANLRAAELATILSEWASSDAGAALFWLFAHSEQNIPLLVPSIGAGLAADPTGATFALAFLDQDHDNGAALAGALVRTLAARGDSAAAVRLAQTEPANWRHEWANVAFMNLAYEDAASALEALSGVDDPALLQTTASAIIAGWAERDPVELAHHIEVFGSPALRDEALATALANWEARDPNGAAAFAAAIRRG